MDLNVCLRLAIFAEKQPAENSTASPTFIALATSSQSIKSHICRSEPLNWSSPSVDLDAKRKIKPPFAWSYVQAVRREAYDGPQWSAERGAASVVWFCPACGKSSFGQSAAAIFGGDGDRPGDWGACASFQDCQGGGAWR